MLRLLYTESILLIQSNIQVLDDSIHKVNNTENEDLDNLNHSNILRHHNHEECVHTSLLHNNKVSQVDRGRLRGNRPESINFQTKYSMAQTKPVIIFIIIA